MIAKFSRIVLWVSFILTIVIAGVYFFGPTEEVALSTQGTTESPVQMDLFLYWVYVIVIVGVAAMLLFAVAQLFTMFKTNPKGALATMSTFVGFFALMGICYALSSETDYSKVVNGATVAYTESVMKMIDMWLYSIYALVGATVLLVVIFGAKKILTK